MTNKLDEVEALRRRLEVEAAQNKALCVRVEDLERMLQRVRRQRDSLLETLELLDMLKRRT
jgi:hypothetical protein